MKTNKKYPVLFFSYNEPFLNTINIALQPYFQTIAVATDDSLMEIIGNSPRFSTLKSIVIDIETLERISVVLHNQLIEITPSIPIIILLTSSDVDKILDFVKSGFHDFIKNPSSINSIIDGINATISKRIKMVLQTQQRTMESIQYRQFRHDLINTATVGVGYVELLLTDLSGTQHGVYCEKISQSLQRLIQTIKNGFTIDTNISPSENHFEI